MAFGAILFWAGFAAYTALFFTIPLALLWYLPGLALGLLISATFLGALGWKGAERISSRMRVVRFSPAQGPAVYSMVKEYCRRLGVPVPRIGMIETPAVNLAVYGFSRQSYQLVLTRGALTQLRREELSALIARQLLRLTSGEVVNESWLSQFLSTVDGLVRLPGNSRPGQGRRFYPLKIFFRQVILYPLTLIPAGLLNGRKDSKTLDLKAARLCRNPFVLTEGLRKLDAFRERVPFNVPFSNRHLFFLPPPAQDPIARVFFDSEGLAGRVRNLESLSKVVPLT